MLGWRCSCLLTWLVAFPSIALQPDPAPAQPVADGCRFAPSHVRSVAKTGLADLTQDSQQLVPIAGAEVFILDLHWPPIPAPRRCVRITFSAQVVSLDITGAGGVPRAYVQAFVNGSIDAVAPNPTGAQAFAAGTQFRTHTMTWTARLAKLFNLIEIRFRTGQEGHITHVHNFHLSVDY